MRKTSLIVACAVASSLGVMAVAAQAQQQTQEPPRIPPTSTGPTFPGPQQSFSATGMPACAPGQRPPCHGPRNPGLPGGRPARAMSGPPPADEGPGPYDPYPRESGRAPSPTGPVRGSEAGPGGCVLRPGVPGGGTGDTCPQAIGGDSTAVITLRCLPHTHDTLATVSVPDVFLKICLPPHISTTTCTGSGGTVEQADGQTACTLPSANVARFRSAVARQTDSDPRRRGGALPRN